MHKKKILYIYDVEFWAIHNVGIFWSKLINDYYDFTFIPLEKYENIDKSKYDYIWWGYSLLINSILPKYRIRKVIPKVIIKKLLLPYNNISVIHDPCELFPQKEHWKQSSPQLNHLKWFNKFAVISNEMQHILSNYEYDCLKINTDSLLSIRKKNDLINKDLNCFSKAYDYPRKNIQLFNEIKEYFKGNIKLNGYFGRILLSEKEYIELIDKHNCYICTSWQEGGPLPIMDAIKRGCVILSTKVGQTDEIIKDGYNGFYCTSYDDFLDKIAYLNNNNSTLFQMQSNSLKMAKNKNILIRNQLLKFLSQSI